MAGHHKLGRYSKDTPVFHLRLGNLHVFAHGQCCKKLHGVDKLGSGLDCYFHDSFMYSIFMQNIILFEPYMTYYFNFYSSLLIL